MHLEIGRFNPFQKKKENSGRLEKPMASILQEIRLDEKAVRRIQRRLRANIRKKSQDPTADIFLGALYPYDVDGAVTIEVDDVLPLGKKGDLLLKLHCLGVQSFGRVQELECKLSELNGGFEEVTRVKFKTLHPGDRIIVKLETKSFKTKAKERKKAKTRKI